MLRAHFEVIKHTNNYILIEDLANTSGTMTVTNDAEEVISRLIDSGYVNYSTRVFYIDTEGRVDELEHNGKEFIGFKNGYDNLQIFYVEMGDIEI